MIMIMMLKTHDLHKRRFTVGYTFCIYTLRLLTERPINTYT
jgi:hypothetical protein